MSPLYFAKLWRKTGCFDIWRAFLSTWQPVGKFCSMLNIHSSISRVKREGSYSGSENALWIKLEEPHRPSDLEFASPTQAYTAVGFPRPAALQLVGGTGSQLHMSAYRWQRLMDGECRAAWHCWIRSLSSSRCAIGQCTTSTVLYVHLVQIRFSLILAG